MSVNTEIDRITQNIANTYAVLSALGADLPEEQNSDNLPTTAGSAKAVLYSEQTLTDDQKDQVRTNIGAVGRAGTGQSAEVFNYQYNKASGDTSHAEGFDTIASGESSHAEGSSTTASGDYSHTEGWVTTTSGESSHAEGYFTVATRRSQHVEGECNVEDTAGENASQRGDYIHIAGNGSSDGNRSNAHTLDWSGNAWFAGDVYVGSTSGINRDEGSDRLARVSELSGFLTLEDLPIYNGEVTDA